MTNILKASRSLMIVSSNLSFTRTVHMSTRHLDVVKYRYPYNRICTLPFRSVLYIERRLTSQEEYKQRQSMVECNCVAFMFDEIRFEFNGAKIYHNENLGMIIIIKKLFNVFTSHFVCENTDTAIGRE